MGSVAEREDGLSYSDEPKDDRKSSQDSKWSKSAILFIHYEVTELNRLENSVYTLNRCKFFQHRTKWPEMMNRLGENQARIQPAAGVECGEIEAFGV
jgi:hypothetical protein